MRELDRFTNTNNIRGNNTLRVSTEVVGSKAFNLSEYEKKEVTDQEIRDDLISYLGEYRLAIQKYDYKLKFRNGKICDSHQEEPMTNKAQKAIDFKRRRGENAYREEAELIGLQRIEDSLRFIKNESATLFWASPPGPKEEGYGNYGFIFTGKYNPLTSDLSMTAIRMENPTILQFNKAMSFLTGRELRYLEAADFLSCPMVLRGEIDSTFIDKVLQESFSFKNNQRNQEISNKVLKKLNPKIEEFIEGVRYLPREERLRCLHTLENYAISLRERYEKEEELGITILDNYHEDKMRLIDLSDRYGHKPPVVAGSCGSSGETKSNNPFSFGFDSLKKVLEGDKEGICSVCHRESSDKHYHCPNKDCNMRYENETDKPRESRTKQCQCGFKFGC